MVVVVGLQIPVQRSPASLLQQALVCVICTDASPPTPTLQQHAFQHESCMRPALSCLWIHAGGGHAAKQLPRDDLN
jgi:hypothetical protein